MSDSTKRVLRRFVKALGAAVVAVVIAQLPLLSEILPRPEIVVPILTAVLLGTDKMLRERA